MTRACRVRLANRKLVIHVAVFTALFAASKLQCGENSQAKERSASDLIRSLTNVPLRLQFDCGLTAEDLENLAAGQSLVRLGRSAISDLERELEIMEKLGMESEFIPNAPLFLDAYARIKGPAASTRLREMIGAPGLAYLSISFDSSIALSLGLTSYVSASREPVVGPPSCRRSEEPRDALDRLIIGWESGDRRLLEAQLGPNATLALNSLLQGRTWEGLRAHIWRGLQESRVAVGYRFLVQGRWSEPEDSLKELPAVAPHAIDPHLNTAFTTASGNDCGWLPVDFRAVRFKDIITTSYLVDNSNLADLLRLVSSCAAQP